jgi:hypothetical protein
MTQPGTAVQAKDDATDLIGIPREMLDRLPAMVMMIDMQTHEIIFANEYMTRTFGKISGEICWRVLQKDQAAPCSFCSDRQLLDEKGMPLGSLRRQVEYTHTRRRYDITESARVTKDGRLIKLGIAMAIDDQKPSKSSGACDSDAELKRFIVMCANCKKIRNQDGKWLPPAVFLRAETDFKVSHGLCSGCIKRLYPDLNYKEDG